MDVTILTLPAFKVRGRKWAGTYEQVPQLKEMIQEVENEQMKIKAADPAYQWGLSFHLIENGFVHYSGFEVEDEKNGEEYEEITIPKHTYMKVHHPSGKDIGETYTFIYRWFQEGNGEPYLEEDTEYFDGLPLKFEKYPLDRDFDDPHLDIYIPIKT